ncbi:heavy-metal-associated domain-containing protein [Caldicellulosiruptoraceae bacterium PP1]
MKKKISIEGMTCQHCVRRVENALKELDGVKSVKVDLAGKSAEVELTQDIDNQKIIAAIDDVGYEVTKIE